MKFSDHDLFKDRAKALEDSYFSEKDSQLLETLKHNFSAQEAEKLLVAATGVQDKINIKELVELTEPHFLAVLAIFPVVEVAWSDGEIQETEREAILSAAHDLGIEAGSQAHKLLGHWLQIPPIPSSIELWTNYVQAICKTLSYETVAKLEQGVLGRARDIAQSAGGFLGFGDKISPSEQACLETLAKAFER